MGVICELYSPALVSLFAAHHTVYSLQGLHLDALGVNTGDGSLQSSAEGVTWVNPLPTTIHQCKQHSWDHFTQKCLSHIHCIISLPFVALHCHYQALTLTKHSSCLPQAFISDLFTHFPSLTQGTQP